MSDEKKEMSEILDQTCDYDKVMPLSVKKIESNSNPVVDFKRWKIAATKPDYCSVYGCCCSENLVGVHIEYLGEEYIIPMCEDHAKDSNKIFDMKGNTFRLKV
jgi:hypothetical protein